MPIGAPVSIGFNSTGAVYDTTDLSITAGGALPAGSTVIVMTGAGNDFSGSTDPVTKVWDGTNNYTKIATVQNGANYIWNFHSFYYSGTPTPTITTQWNQSNRIKFIQAVYITGLAPSGALDKSGITSATTGTSISLASGTLAQAEEIILGGAYIDGSTAYGAGTGFTNVLNNTNGLSQRFVLDYRIVSSTATQTWSPSWTGSSAFSAQLISLKGAAAAFSPTNMPMMGL